jgi:hypothetical protein
MRTTFDIVFAILALGICVADIRLHFQLRTLAKNGAQQGGSRDVWFKGAFINFLILVAVTIVLAATHFVPNSWWVEIFIGLTIVFAAGSALRARTKIRLLK